MNPNDLFDNLMADYEEEYLRHGNRAEQEDLDDRKVSPEGGALVPARIPNRNGPEIRLPAVKPANNSRRSRQQAAAEQDRQWRMVQTTRRTFIADGSVVAVAIHAQRRLDLAQESMADRFYSLRRHPAMNEFMSRVTSRCLSMAEAGVMAILESHPKRIAEDL